MIELGQWLRDAREAKGLSLAQAEAATRIRQKYLAALESGNWDEMPNNVAARGFLRTYATYLGVDSAQALSRLAEANTVPLVSGTTGEETLGPRAVDYRPIEVDLIRTTPASLTRWVIIGVAGVVLVVAIFLVVNGLPRQNQATAALVTPTKSNEPQITVAPTSPPFRITATPTAGLFSLPTPTSTATAAVTVQPSVTVTTTIADIRVVISTTQRSWVSVTTDGAIAFQEIMDTGIEKQWTVKQSLVVRTGNAGGINITINDENQGPLGQLGDIEECTWTLTSGVVNKTCASNASTTLTTTVTLTNTPAIVTPAQIITATLPPRN